MLTIHELSFHIGSRTLYDQASLQVKPKDRIGLIGANGTGKTTLLKLITGQYTPDGGSITQSNDCTIGFLNQDLLSFEFDSSILDVAMEAFADLIQIHEQMEAMLKKMEEDPESVNLDRLADLQDKFQTMDGYAIQHKAEQVLEGLGFKTADLQRPLRTFSGGWRMRVMLAKLLLQNPSLLMLDEPTNHLDLPSIQWIEQYLANYCGSVIIVSHDRQFLDGAINTIVEVAGGKLNRYEGNYSFYEKEKALRSDIQRNAFKNQQQKIKQTERFIERFRSKATKARQVQSKVKMLDKMDMVEQVDDSIDAMKLKFSFSLQPGKIVGGFEKASKAYGTLKIVQQSTAYIERGDKIALIGANGKGKSTVLRMLAGTESYEGKPKQGHNVVQTFYAQHQLESLTLDNEILDELKQAGSKKTEAELRTILGCFLFNGDEVFKKIGVLSGGEKSRVALAKTLLSEANFLLLDEPTNHLDITSVNILIQALQQYEGSFVVVSHDRHFISQIANKIWYIEDQLVKEYPGTYHEYSDWIQKKEQAKATAAQQEQKPIKTAKKPAKPPVRKQDEQQIKKLKKATALLEKQIEELETAQEKLEMEMASPEIYQDQKKYQEKHQSYQQQATLLEKLHQDWEDYLTQLEALGVDA